MAEPKVTAVDLALGHAVTAWVTTRLQPHEHNDMLREVIQRASVPCSRSHPIIQRLAEWGLALATADPGSSEATYVRLQAEAAVREFAMWRLGPAMDAAKRQRAGREND